jgi:hypothetical protein
MSFRFPDDGVTAKWHLVVGSWVIGGIPLKGILGTQTFLCLLSGWCEMSNLLYHVLLSMMFHLATGPK